jgi:hypothetical protein
MKGQISFDILIEDNVDCPVFEGCYRVPPADWRVFYFTKWWQEGPEALVDATFCSGAKGVNVKYPKDSILNKIVIQKTLSKLLGVSEWQEVRGPDSLQLK